MIKYNTGHHEVQRNLDLIGYNYSGDEWKVLPELKISSDIKNKIDTYFMDINLNNKFISIAPGSVWNTKIYPVEYLEEVIEYIIKNSSYNILLIGGEKDESLCSGIASKFQNNVKSAAGKFSLIESVEILKRSDLAITNDSAPTHFAMCAGIPALTLYCSTVVDFGFYPYTPNSSYLSFDDLFCKPCGIHGYEKCPINTFECGYGLKPGIVIKKLKELLNAEESRIN